MLKKLKLAVHNTGVQKYLLTALLAVFTANSTVLGYSSPLGAVISAYLPMNLSIVFVAVMFISRVLIGIDTLSLATLFSSLIVCLVRFVRSRFNVKKKSFTHLLYPLFAYFACALLFLIAFSSELTDYLIAIIFCATVFVLSLSCSKISDSNISPIIFVAAITLASSIDLTYINIGRILGIYSVLAIGYSFGAVSACYVGILASVGVSLYDPSLFQSTVFVCVIALICANKGTSKKLQIPIYSVATAIICAVLSGSDINAIGFVIDTLISSSLYLFTDRKAFAFVSAHVSHSNVFDSASNLAISHINSQKHAVSSVSELLKKILNASSGSKTIAPLDSVYSDICMRCQNHNFCYKADSSDPKTALSSCSKRKEVEKHIDLIKHRNEYISKLSASRQVKLGEAISTLELISNVISDISVRSNKIRSLNNEMTNKLTSLFAENRIDASACYVFDDNSIYVDIKKGRRISETKLCLIIGDMMNYDYSLPEVTELGGLLRFSFHKKPLYRFDCGVYTESADGSDSGDTFEYFTFGNKLYCILSDGMGTGKSAGISSSLLISLLKRQLLCGMGEEAAVSVASVAMRSVGTDESFATLDLLAADLNTGELRFIKAGSYKSYVIGEGICDISTGGYPIGILHDINTKNVSVNITSDVTAIVMLTDGAKDIPYQLIEKTVREQIALSSEEIAQNIFESAKKLLYCAQRDDLTLAVLKIEREPTV